VIGEYIASGEQELVAVTGNTPVESNNAVFKGKLWIPILHVKDMVIAVEGAIGELPVEALYDIPLTVVYDE
jgi:hypothetical protein